VIYATLGKLRNSKAANILCTFSLTGALEDAWTVLHATTSAPPRAVFDDALSYLDSNTRRPLFLWVHVLPPHEPYCPPQPFKYSFLKDPVLDSYLSQRGLFGEYPPSWQSAIDKLRLRYDEHVAYSDFEIGRFLNRLKARGYFESSLIILTADH